MVLAATITVSPGQSLESIIENTVNDGDTIYVNPGTYTIGTVEVKRSNLTIEAQGEVTLKDGMIILMGNGNTLRGFKMTGKNVKTPIRTYGNNNLVEGNEIYDTAEDAMWLWGEGNVIRGNYMHDIYDDRSWPTVDQHVDCFMTWAWAQPSYYTKVNNLTIENNICVLDRTQGSNQFFILTHEGGMPEVIIKNNAIIGYSSAYRNVNSTINGSNNIINPTGLENYQNYQVSRVSKKAFSITGFSPQANSSVINKGTNVNVNTDFNGNVRDSLSDVGAFEYLSTTSSPSPKLGDANGDNKVDGVDYTIWLNNYGG
jgi:hypothetical protein